eukprot:Gb_15255 [translate_table: standard]
MMGRTTNQLGNEHGMSINELCHYLLFPGLFVAFTYSGKQPPASGASPYFLCTPLSPLGPSFRHIPSNFSNYNVFTNSNANAPLFYQISGTWSNHEGSISPRRRKPAALLDPSRGGKMSFASLNKGARRSRNKGSRERVHSERNTNLSSHLARDAKDRASSIDEQRIDSAVGTALFFSPSLSASSNPSARNLFVRALMDTRREEAKRVVHNGEKDTKTLPLRWTVDVNTVASCQEVGGLIINWVGVASGFGIPNFFGTVQIASSRGSLKPPMDSLSHEEKGVSERGSFSSGLIAAGLFEPASKCLPAPGAAIRSFRGKGLKTLFPLDPLAAGGLRQSPLEVVLRQERAVAWAELLVSEKMGLDDYVHCNPTRIRISLFGRSTNGSRKQPSHSTTIWWFSGARRKLSVLTASEVEINPSKSLCSDNDSFEFATRFIWNNVEIPSADSVVQVALSCRQKRMFTPRWKYLGIAMTSPIGSFSKTPVEWLTPTSLIESGK